jgi:hypothetical protein
VKLRILEACFWQAQCRDSVDIDVDLQKRGQEATTWIAIHLPSRPLCNDALSLWAESTVSGVSMRNALRHRRQTAEMNATRKTLDENKKRALVRKVIADEIVASANREIEESAGDAARFKRIKIDADIRFRRAVDDANAWNVTIKPAEAMPGKVLTDTTLNRYRKAACQIIADHLNSAGLPVTEASPGISKACITRIMRIKEQHRLNRKAKCKRDVFVASYPELVSPTDQPSDIDATISAWRRFLKTPERNKARTRIDDHRKRVTLFEQHGVPKRMNKKGDHNRLPISVSREVIEKELVTTFQRWRAGLPALTARDRFKARMKPNDRPA